MKSRVLIAMVSFATLVAAVVFPALAGVSVRTVDFLAGQRLSVNAAGPVLLRMDDARNRLIVANTLTSSVTVVDCATGAIRNIPVGARALQHLKAEALTLNARTRDVYLIGTKCLIVAHPDANRAETIPTAAQFESTAVDETTGNAFLAGRESKEIGFYKPGAKKLSLVKWLDHREDLINLNATPPPPIRKAVADAAAGEVLAVDGFTSTLFVFNAKSAELLRSRPIALAPGGRWHFAGYDAGARELFLVIETAERKVIQAARIDAALYVTEFDPKTNKFALLHKETYPFGETRFDTGNVSFYIRGQFGDAVFSITEGRTDKDGRLWITDFLSGKAFILKR